MLILWSLSIGSIDHELTVHVTEMRESRTLIKKFPNSDTAFYLWCQERKAFSEDDITLIQQTKQEKGTVFKRYFSVQNALLCPECYLKCRTRIHSHVLSERMQAFDDESPHAKKEWNALAESTAFSFGRSHGVWHTRDDDPVLLEKAHDLIKELRVPLVYQESFYTVWKESYEKGWKSSTQNEYEPPNAFLKKERKAQAHG